MMHLLRRSLPLLVLASLATAAPSLAENLLVNAGFDSDLSGWTVDGMFTHAAWNRDDVAEDPSSGSVRLTNPASEERFFVSRLNQCVPVVGGAQYDFGAFIREPPGQSASGRALVELRWFPNGACEGFDIGGSPGAVPIENIPGEWVLAQEESSFATVFAPEAAASAIVSLEVVNNDQPEGTRTALFDDVRFCPDRTCALFHPDHPSLNLVDDPGANDFQFRVAIEAGAEAFPAVQERACLAETLCTSGALPGRVEVQLRVIGPRPNGFLWFQVLRFTPSRIVVEAVHFSAEKAEVHYYVLPAVGPGDRPTNLEDRTAFVPP
jgi:hypothetical protein